MDTFNISDAQGILGKLLQRMDSLTLTLSEKKHDLETFAHKAQEAADTLDVASTKLISNFSDVAQLEQTLQETLRSGIETAAQHIAVQASHEMQQSLRPMQASLNDAINLLHHSTGQSVYMIRKQRWTWMVVSGVFGAFIASIVAAIMILYYPSKTSEIDQKLQTYGRALLDYAHTLTSKEQKQLFKHLGKYIH